MAILYLDTSALLKLFVREPGTELMTGLAASVQNRLAVSSLAPVEFRSAIRRREREGDLPKQAVRGLLDHFDARLSDKFLQQPVNESVIEEALLLLDRHALRALDALQLASCRVLQASINAGAVFVCSDQTLLGAASSERIQYLDPVDGSTNSNLC